MSIHNPPNLYTGGAVTFNSTPATQFAINMMARKAAKDDALDQYYRELDSKVNQAGMRTQDIPSLINNENARHEFYQKNKQAILNPRIDGGQAQTKFNQLYQQSLGLVNQSKGEAQRYNQIVPLLLDPDKRSRLTDSFLEQLHAHDLPITDPNHKSFDVSQVDFTTPFDQQKYLKNFTDVKRTQVGLPKIDIDPKTYRGTITTTQGFDDNAKQTIAGRAMVSYRNDIGFHSEINKLSEEVIKNKNKYSEYNNVYKQAFGKDLDIQHPEELAAAYTMKMLQPTISESKPTEDVFGREKALASIHHSYRLAEIGAEEGKEERVALWKQKHGISQGGNYSDVSGNAFDGMPDEKFDKFEVKSGLFFKGDGTPVNGKVFITKDKIPAVVKSALKAGGLDIENIGQGVDANVKNGVIQSISNKHIGTVTRDDMQNVYQRKMDTEPLKGKHLKFGNENETKSTSDESYSRSELKKAGWTDAQIETAVKAGKIKVND